MQISVPKTKRLRKHFELKCQFPGCDKTYYGLSYSKYCEKHRGSKLYYKAREKIRVAKRRKRKEFEQQNTANVTLITKMRYTATYCCALEGCSNIITVVVNPRVSDYPKYCEEHRNEYRRILFLKHQSEKEGNNVKS
jgi:hypothetical protein